MEDKLVTIACFKTVTNAHIARARLAADGIDAIVINENMGTINPYYGSNLVEVELQVRAVDIERAKASLGMANVAKETSPPDPEACPRCGSQRIVRNRNPLILIICFLLYVYDPALGQRRWRCLKCHHAWKTR